ncbi:MAG: DUF4126 domain-containing protein [Chromatiaceae bacterium]|nr:DUF4126 domain-containing protein [Chromatiaceae bacterium]
MESLTQTLALSLGAGWASGINLYAAILVLGFLGATGRMALPGDMEVLADPLVMFAAGFMYLVEFFADKIPGVDTAWDTLHTFIRIPAGAILAANAVGDVGPGAEIAAALLGGGMAAASHAAKAGTRVLINTSPEPFTNWTASILEDFSVVAGLLVALNHPVLFLVLLAVFLLLLIWLLPKLWRGIKRVFGALARWFGGGKKRTETDPPVSDTSTLDTKAPGKGVGRGPDAR